MTTKQKAAQWAAREESEAFADAFTPLSAPAAASRDIAADMGVEPVSPAVASTLTLLAAAVSAKAVVELGTGTGTSGLALLTGMVPGGILTSIDIEAEHQATARKVFKDAQIPPQRARLISESALNVLPRLTDGAYDIVFADADVLESVEYMAQAERLLRPGGLFILHHALAGDRIGDESDEADETVIMREALQAISEQESNLATLMPIGDGLLVALKR